MRTNTALTHRLSHSLPHLDKYTMPAVPPGSKILLTGANGFAAVWIVRELLDNGFSVCGTVRSEVAAAYLRGLFKDFGARFKTAIVEDITKVCALD